MAYKFVPYMAGGAGGGPCSWNDLTDKPFDAVSIYTCESSAKFTGNDGHVDASESLVEGNSYTVVFDGVPYKCVARYSEGAIVLGNTYIVMHDINTGEPFCIAQEAGSKKIMGFLEDGGEAEHTVEILVVNTLDPKYLPEQNHSWNDLTDKPFGSSDIAPIVNHAFDDNFDYGASVWANNHPFIKVSDVVLSANDVIGGTVYFKGWYQTVPTNVAAENVIECDGGIVITTGVTNLVISVAKTDANAWFDVNTSEFSAFPVPEPGTYFMFGEGGGTERMVFPPKTLDAKYLPKHIHSWSDLGEIAIYTCSNSAKFTGDDSYIDASESLVEGNTYIVVFDGVRYECIAGYNVQQGYCYLGNNHTWSGNAVDTGEPFGIWQSNGSKTIMGFLPSGDYEEHTIQIIVKHNIDEKFIPDTIARVEDVKRLIAEAVAEALSGN